MKELKIPNQNRRKRRETDIGTLSEPGRAREAGWVQMVGADCQSEQGSYNYLQKETGVLGWGREWELVEKRQC